jgi:hypothetical protein
MDNAACAGTVYPELFTGEGIVRDHELARLVIDGTCNSCPVIDDCVEWALGEGFFEGIAGGLIWTTKHVRTPRGRLVTRAEFRRKRTA